MIQHSPLCCRTRSHTLDTDGARISLRLTEVLLILSVSPFPTDMSETLPSHRNQGEVVKGHQARGSREDLVWILSFPYGSVQPSSAPRTIAAIYSMNDSMPEVFSVVICKLEVNVNTVFLVSKMEYFRKEYMRFLSPFSLKMESEIWCAINMKHLQHLVDEVI